MKKSRSSINLGALRNEVEHPGNIIYYRKDFSELSINITNRCPNQCPFCIRDRNVGWGVSNLYLDEDPSIDDIVIATNKALDDSILMTGSLPEKIKICGYGEPILRIADLVSIISRISDDKGPLNWQLTTTGWPIFHIKNGESYLADLYSAGVYNVYMSMHAINENDYNKLLRPMNDEGNSFDQAIAFTRLTRKIGYDVTLAFINMKSELSQAQMERIIAFARELDCRYHLRKFET